MTLDGIWACLTFVEVELSFPFAPDDCLVFVRPGETLVRYSAHVSGSSDELTGRGRSQTVGPFNEASENENDLAKYVWVGSVEAGLLVLNGVVNSTQTEDTPTQLWIDLDTGDTQIVYELPGPDPLLKINAILLGFSKVSTNQ